MNVKKLVIAVILAISPATHNVYAYNEDLFDANGAPVNKVEIVHSSEKTSDNVSHKTKKQDVYNDHLFDDIEIKGKPSNAQMDALKSLSVRKTEVKQEVVKTVEKMPVIKVTTPEKVKKEETKKNVEHKDAKEKTVKPEADKVSSDKKENNSDQPAFQVVKENIVIPADTRKNKIQLEEIEDRNLPSVLGPVGEINEWKPVDKNTTPKPVKAKVKQADPEQSDPTSDANVDKFYGIDKALLNTDTTPVSKAEKIDKTIPLPTNIDLPGNKKSVSQKQTATPESKSKTASPSATQVKKDEPVHKGGFFNGTKNSGSVDKKTENIKTDSDEVPITSRKLSINFSSLPIIPSDLTTPKAIRGDKVDNKLLGSQVYIRIFKEEHSLELWLKEAGQYQLANVYDICTYSGGLGPKKVSGDHKSPEGFYKISHNNLQPNSKYYKAINIGFPNNYDRSHGYSGQFLMIHGSCVSIGCYAMTDNYIKEIYKFVEAAFRNGQSDIDISIYPFRMTDKNLNRYKTNTNYAFWKQLQPGYEYFETTGKPPGVSVNDGKYVINSGVISSNGMYAKN